MNKNIKKIISKKKLLFLCFLLIFLALFLFPQKNKEGSSEEGLVLETSTADSAVEILFVGDIMLDRIVRVKAEKNQNPCYAFGKIQPFLRGFDAVIANNEGAITDQPSKSIPASIDYSLEKDTARNYYKFTFDSSVVQCYKENNITAVSLGNNHSLDFGEEGLISTTNYLKDAGIAYFGNPISLEENILTKNIKGVEIVIVGYSFKDGHPLEKIVEQIKEADQSGYLVIAYPHWAFENKTEFGNDEQRYIARSFIDAGADAVIGTHPHTPQNSEIYKGKYIFYSLASFIFDFKQDKELGMGVIMNVNKKTKEIYFDTVDFDYAEYFQVFVKKLN